MTDQVSAPADTSNYSELTADIVSAYVSKNSMRPADLPALISEVHGALQTLGELAAPQQLEKLTPPVSVKKSLTPDFLISMEDGKRYKSLKRHLSTRGLTPEQYRQKWSLPWDYPMVAPNYAAQRSELARKIGLGQSRNRAAAKTASTVAKVSAPVAKKGKGGRKKPS